MNGKNKIPTFLTIHLIQVEFNNLGDCYDITVKGYDLEEEYIEFTEKAYDLQGVEELIKEVRLVGMSTL